jgi:DNA-binding LytR/AlgR family response regulator
MTTLRVVAIDDEPLALRRVEWCLEGVPDIELVGKTTDSVQGLELIRSRNADVVLLDVEMPGMSGFELIDALGEGAVPEIVFISAFDHFAVQAYETSAVDYLLKPVEQKRLLEALQRARARRELRDASAHIAELRDIIEKLRTDRRRTTRQTYETELWIREGDARVRIPVDMLDRIEADGDYVRLHVGQRVRLLRARINDLGERLDPGRFVRIHRSEIVRHDLVSAIRRHSSGRCFAVLAGGREVPISKRYLASVSGTLHLRKRDREEEAS